MFFKSCRLIVLGLGTLYGSAIHAADLPGAEALIRGGQAERAYQLLAAEEFEQAGNVDFDYLLGLAALESGHPAAATLALERVLALEPNFVGARLDMARAYFALGSFDLAERELAELDKLSPPPAARLAIDQYRDAIAQRRNPRRTVIGAYLEAGIGHDSNVNTATDVAEIGVPALGGTVTLSSSSLETRDTYFSVGGGANIRHRIGDRVTLVGGAKARHRDMTNEHDFEDSAFDANAGVEVASEQFVFTASARFGREWLGASAYRRTPGVGLGINYALGDRDRLQAFGAFNWLRYDQSASVAESSNVATAGATWLHTFGDGGRNLFAVTGYGGYDNDVASRADGNRRFYGARLALQHRYTKELDVMLAAGGQYSRYDAQNLLFEATRREFLADAVLALEWRFAPAWRLRPQLRYQRNYSTFDIYTYDRWDARLSVRREFSL